MRKKMPQCNLELQLMTIIPPDSEYIVPIKKLQWNRHNHPRYSITPSYRDIGHLKKSIIWANWSHECYPYLPLIELPSII